jgi:hypothetical protein
MSAHTPTLNLLGRMRLTGMMTGPAMLLCRVAFVGNTAFGLLREKSDGY